jgi:predicted site-specific integrase-resolvase
MEQQKLYCPAKEMAFMLSISTQVVKQWARDGVVPAVKPLNKWLFNPEKVIKALEEKTKKKEGKRKK